MLSRIVMIDEVNVPRERVLYYVEQEITQVHLSAI